MSGGGWGVSSLWWAVLPQALRTLLFVCLRGDVRAAHGRGTIPRVLPGCGVRVSAVTSPLRVRERVLCLAAEARCPPRRCFGLRFW